MTLMIDILELVAQPEERWIELARHSSNFDKRPSLHPERKGMLNRSKLKNWVEKNGGLPTYINSIATAILRTKPSWSISRVIATAVNMVKRMCAGQSTAIVKKVSAAVKAAACKAVAQWNSKKAAASEEVDAYMIELAKDTGPPTSIAIRNMIRSEGKNIPESLEVTDREVMEYMGIELSDDERREEVNDLDLEEYLGLAEQAAHDIAVAWFPVLDMSVAEKIDDAQYEKEIVRVGTIKDKKSGKEIKFDGQFLKEFKSNFDAVLASNGYVPVQDVTDDNRHTDRTRYQVGIVNELRLDDEENPTRVIARIKLNDDMKNVVDFNPKIGVSIGASYTHLSEDGRPTNVFPRHIAITHRPKLQGMEAWKKLVKMSDAGEELTLDLTDADFTEGLPEREDTSERSEVEMADINFTELMENAEFKNAFESAVAAQVATATQEKDQRIQELENSVGQVQRSSYEQAVNLAIESYAQAGVPRSVREPAKALLLSFEAGEESRTLNLTEGEGDESETVELSRWQVVTRLLDEVKGVIDMSERSSGEDDETVVNGQLTGDARKAAVEGLVNLARSNRS